jgi:phage baseplate assembly protein W
MATIKLQTLNEPEKLTDGYTYNDLHLDLQYSFTRNNELLRQREIKDVVTDYDYAAIRNSIFNIFTTIPGQKILEPSFGLNLLQHIFKPCDTFTARQIARDIVDGLTRYEPRINLINVEVIAVPEESAYEVTLTINVPKVGLGSFKLVGTLSNSGFFFNK